MYPANTWCFDLEIVNAILDKGATPEPGINYCKGWNDHAGMGISVLVVSRPDGSDVQAFVSEFNMLADNPTLLTLTHFAELVRQADLVIGHCSRQFDAKVLAAKGIYIDDRKHLDFYHEVKKSLNNNFPKGYNLNLLSQRCGGPAKSGDGGQAPHMWQRGQRQEVIDYCINDIKMTAAIASFYGANGANIPGTGTGQLLQLRHPQQIRENG